uniref:TPA-induced transmembrane protein isoform X2 n=1 Tax=Monopterus albus TaxID=43700 RepID=UPI0009B42709|nr:TPA-induced transmembrane protein isoform X2 [Monopterus albus]
MQTSMNFELKEVKTNGSDGATCLANEEVTTGNGDGAAHRTVEVTERDGLLSEQIDGSNGSAGHEAEVQMNRGNACTQDVSNVHRIKRELNEVIFWKIRRWMVIVIILIIILLVIFISLALCSAIYDDEEEKIDPSLLKVPQYFNGSFQLPNLISTEDLVSLSSTESQTLAADLQKKLADLYTSSPALGQYFSKAEIFAFRNGSVIADYQLTFLMPEEQQDQLRQFTLSREMVYNVFRQFLYDQEPDKSERLFIDPVSLSMV